MSNNPEKYLGLPAMVGRRNKHAFFGIKEKLPRKLKSWSVRHLLVRMKEVGFLPFVHLAEYLECPSIVGTWYGPESREWRLDKYME
ncbi:reverse transcriptase [Gossypium australe]|uniref:Reverse transcriptase n=1 Tax=Gossypium australe TaxID=47621 RepID=A0A5B6WIS7_9ROSI|nr:reverse transcriptase [Gossypium australe]